jgi:hypothetical protein
MDRKRCRRIVKTVSRLLLVQIAEVVEEEITREKEGMGKKVVGQEKYTWWKSITLKELYAEDPTEYRTCLRMSP